MLFDFAFAEQLEHIDRRACAGSLDMQMGTERLLCIDRFRDRAERLACCDRLPRNHAYVGQPAVGRGQVGSVRQRDAGSVQPVLKNLLHGAVGQRKHGLTRFGGKVGTSVHAPVAEGWLEQQFVA